MKDIVTITDLKQLALSIPSPKPTSRTNGQVESNAPIWTSEDGAVRVGVWECTPGVFTADRTGNSEICYILSGLVEMRHVDGRVERLGAGDSLILPKGWAGEWNIIETTRKMYVTHTP